MKKYLIIIYLFLMPITCFSQPINLGGTSWVGRDGTKQLKYEIQFFQNGTFEYSYFDEQGKKVLINNTGVGTGNWSQSGDSVHMEINKFSEKKGIIKGSVMHGTAANQKGDTWNWSYQLVNSSQATLANRAQPNQNPQKGIGSSSFSDKNEMGRFLSECWYYWSYAQIVMIKSGKASPQQLANIKEKVELAQDLSFKLIGKQDATTYWMSLSKSYRFQRDAGIDIIPEVNKEATKCSNFLDNIETANAIKRMLN